MSLSAVFLAGIGLTLLIAFGIVVYLRQALHAILLDLCGNQERAYFWRAFSSVILVLVPAWCALDYRSSGDFAGPALFQITGILKWAFSGLLLALAGIGAVLTVFIRKQMPAHALSGPVSQERPKQ